MQKSEHKIRPPKPSDLNFIFATFSTSMKHDSDLGRSCRSSVFFPNFQKIIDDLLQNSQILVTCSVEEENAIMAYLIYSPNLIHYAFTRPALREKGLARELVNQAFPGATSLAFSLNTNHAKKISRTHQQLFHDPFSLFKKGA